jgi:hypothetical protein
MVMSLADTRVRVVRTKDLMVTGLLAKPGMMPGLSRLT